jgi:NADH dehydrogenase FAD-containing subunit
VVVGPGPTGVEMAEAVAEIARSRGNFLDVDTARARVLLVEVADRVLTGFPPSLTAKAARALRGTHGRRSCSSICPLHGRRRRRLYAREV